MKNVINPVSCLEIARAIQIMPNKPGGVDKITVKTLKNI